MKLAIWEIICLVRSLDQHLKRIENNVMGRKWLSSCASFLFAVPMTVPKRSWAGQGLSVCSICWSMCSKGHEKLWGMKSKSFFAKPSGPRAARGLNCRTVFCQVSTSKGGKEKLKRGMCACVNLTTLSQTSAFNCESRFHLGSQCCVNESKTS